MTHLRSRSLIRLSAAGVLELALTLGVVMPSSASAQESARLQGIVAEEGTGRAIPSAVVTLVGTDRRARSDRDGAFTFSDVRVGSIVVRVEAKGYPTVVDEVAVSPGAVVLVQMFLPRPAAVLEEILVTGTRRTEVREARTAADLVARQVPYLQGFTAGFNSTRGRAYNPPVQLRGPSGFTDDGEPVIVLDGARMSGLGPAMDALRQIPASQIKEIQILRGASSAHLYGSPAGVISIRTVSGAP